MHWYAWLILFENSVMRAFRDRGALSPETAATQSELGLRSGSLFNHLVSQGVIRRVSPERFYLHEAHQSRYLVRRRWTAVVLAASLVALAFVLAALRH